MRSNLGRLPSVWSGLDSGRPFCDALTIFDRRSPGYSFKRASSGKWRCKILLCTKNSGQDGPVDHISQSRSNRRPELISPRRVCKCLHAATPPSSSMEAASFLIVIFRFSPFLHLRKLFMQDGGAFNRFLASRKKEPLRNRGGPAAPSSAGYFSLRASRKLKKKTMMASS